MSRPPFSPDPDGEVGEEIRFCLARVPAPPAGAARGRGRAVIRGRSR